MIWQPWGSNPGAITRTAWQRAAELLTALGHPDADSVLAKLTAAA